MADKLYLIRGETLTGIGDAIRQLTGTTEKIPVLHYENRIIDIEWKNAAVEESYFKMISYRHQ